MKKMQVYFKIYLSLFKYSVGLFPKIFNNLTFDNKTNILYMQMMAESQVACELRGKSSVALELYLRFKWVA
jgi:hypothetical protein